MSRAPKGYWEKRSTELLKNIEEQTLYTINDLVIAYNKATKDINNEIEKIYNKYTTDNKLTKNEAMTLLSQQETNQFYKQLLEKIDKVTDDDIKQKLLAKYNAPAYAYRITRYQALQDNIDIELKKLAGVEKEITKLRYVDTIEEGYYRNIFNIQKKMGVGFNFSQMDKKTIDLMLNNKWNNKANYSQRIWNNSERLSDYLRTSMIADTMTGKSIPKMASELNQAMETGLYNATRLVRTETNYFANQAEMLSYEECGIEEYQFIATLDHITCEHCAELDKRVFKVKEARPGKNCPPIHPNDRCTTVAYFGEDDKELERIARDPLNDKNYNISNMSYDEWKNQYGKEAIDKYYKMYVNEKKDKEQYKRYKNILEKEFVPEKFEKFQDLKYNKIEEYNDLKGYYIYISNYPESNREFYEVNNKVKQLVNIEQVKAGIGTAVKPNVKNIKISSINIHAEKRMQQRKITKDMAQSYIDNAVIEFAQNTKRLYISSEGATVLLKEDNRLITTYNTFDEDVLKILEVINGRKN